MPSRLNGAFPDGVTPLRVGLAQAVTEVRDFLADLCTPAEVRAFIERLEVARLLDAGDLSYRQIAEQAGASTTTVVRVARFLKEMPFKGYRRALDGLKETGQ